MQALIAHFWSEPVRCWVSVRFGDQEALLDFLSANFPKFNALIIRRPKEEKLENHHEP